MAETIINSNQLRASGDTSTQTLIGANQVRQSGDTSSQTLLNKNQIAGGGGSYQVVDYIESSGTQYIDTGFIPNKDTKIEITANLLSRSNSPYLFGAGKGWENSFFAITVNSIQSNGCIFCFNNNSSHRYQFFNINNKYTINLSKDYSQVISNGSTWNGGSYSNYSSFVTTENTLLLFAIHWASESDEPQDFAQMKLYGCKIWNNEILVRDFVPVYDNISQKYGLYDLASKSFFGNSGTGSFSGGNE